MISIDGDEDPRDASRGANRTDEKLVADILKEAEETDRWEDGLFGADRGDECLSICGPRRGAGRRSRRRRSGSRRRPAVARSRRWRGSSWIRSGSATRGGGRRAWQRGRTRSCCAGASRPRSRSRVRAARLLEALHRLEENHQVEIQASEAYERVAGGAARRRRAWTEARDAAQAVHPAAGARGCDEQDRPGLADDAHPGTADGAGLQRAGRGHPRADHRRRGDRGREPRLRSPRTGRPRRATRARRCRCDTAPGDGARRRGLLAQRQMENIVSDGIQVLVPPDAGLREGTRPGWDKGPYAFMRRVLSSESGPSSTSTAKRRSSRCSRRTSSTAASADSSDEAEPRHAQSGGSRQRSTTCSSSTTTG